MRFLADINTPPMGLGCWAIGGPFFAGDRAVGWGEVDDAVSTRAIHTALDHGIRFFDTAQAYGTGHSETVLGAALKDRPDVKIATKIGLEIAPETRQLVGEMHDPVAIRATIAESHKRLQRDHIDLVLLHPNSVPNDVAAPIFDMLDALVADGSIGGYGWSTDFPDHFHAFAARPGFVAVEHAMNLFVYGSHMVNAVKGTDVTALIRSPLAMGILGGKHGKGTTFGKNDVRGGQDDWNDYFADGRINPDHMARLDAVREILTSDGRSLAQGALAWLWGRAPNCVPIPGFRTPEQVTDLAGARQHGPLSTAHMAEIETLLQRPPEGPPQAR